VLDQDGVTCLISPHLMRHEDLISDPVAVATLFLTHGVTCDEGMTGLLAVHVHPRLRLAGRTG